MCKHNSVSISNNQINCLQSRLSFFYHLHHEFSCSLLAFVPITNHNHSLSVCRQINNPWRPLLPTWLLYMAALILAKRACLSSSLSHLPLPFFLLWISSPVSTSVISKLPVVPGSAVNVVFTTPLPNSSSRARQRAS